MQNWTKRCVLALVTVGLLTLGSVTAQAAPHQINLRVPDQGRGEPQNHPVYSDKAQMNLRARRNDTLSFAFPGQPGSVTVTISSQQKIDRNSRGGPPYEYDGLAGININPVDGVTRIKYDVIVEGANRDFDVLDPMIIIDD